MSACQTLPMSMGQTDGRTDRQTEGSQNRLMLLHVRRARPNAFHQSSPESWCTVECICGRSNPRHSANRRRLSNYVQRASYKKRKQCRAKVTARFDYVTCCEGFAADDVDVNSPTSHCANWLLLKVIVQGQIDMLSFNDTVDTSTAGWTTVSKCKCSAFCRSGRLPYIVL